jgi:hypothetical protein
MWHIQDPNTSGFTYRKLFFFTYIFDCFLEVCVVCFWYAILCNSKRGWTSDIGSITFSGRKCLCGPTLDIVLLSCGTSHVRIKRPPANSTKHASFKNVAKNPKFYFRIVWHVPPPRSPQTETRVSQAGSGFRSFSWGKGHDEESLCARTESDFVQGHIKWFHLGVTGATNLHACCS